MIAGIKPYAETKNTDIEWLESVPMHWELVRVKQVFFGIDVRSSTGLEELLTVSSDRGVVPRKSASVTMFKAESYVDHKLCWPDDLVINSLWAWAGGLGVSKFHGLISSAYGVYRLRDPNSQEAIFFHRLFRSVPFNYELKVRSQGIWTSRLLLSDNAFLSAPIPLPPYSEQKSIARFLNRMELLFERYIRSKEKLTALLEEQKQIMIHDAVTGRIDVRTGQPYPSYRPSDFGWIRKVPKHWETRRIKAVCHIRYGLGQPLPESINGLPMLRATNIKRGRITEKNLLYVNPLSVPSSGNPILREKEIIVVRSGAYTADSAIVPKRYEGAVAGYDMVATAFAIQPEFLAQALLCTYLRDNQLIPKSMRSAQPHLNAEELGSCTLLLPPSCEQEVIADFLERATAEIQNLIDSKNVEIELAHEYRTRLIADVVTGKLDVREAAANLPELKVIADGGCEKMLAEPDSQQSNTTLHNEAPPITPGGGS